MDFLAVKNWEQFQHYKLRNPPWIRLYVSILTDYDFLSLLDNERYQLLAIWLLASRLQNKIPDDNVFIEKQINSSTPIDLEKFVSMGFLKRASKALARCKQSAKPYTDNSDSSDDSDNSNTDNSDIAPAHAYAIPSAPKSLIQDSWNLMAEKNGLSKILSLTKKRESQLKSRWSNPFWRENWESALKKIPESNFLLGQSAGSTWKCSFDFFIAPDSVAKIMEDKYKNPVKDGERQITGFDEKVYTRPEDYHD